MHRNFNNKKSILCQYSLHGQLRLREHIRCDAVHPTRRPIVPTVLQLDAQLRLTAHHQHVRRPFVLRLEAAHVARIGAGHVERRPHDGEGTMRMQRIRRRRVIDVDVVLQHGQRLRWLFAGYPLVDVLIVQQPLEDEALLAGIDLVLAVEHQLGRAVGANATVVHDVHGRHLQADDAHRLTDCEWMINRERGRENC